jgi:hypothetical protein
LIGLHRDQALVITRDGMDERDLDQALAAVEAGVDAVASKVS